MKKIKFVIALVLVSVVSFLPAQAKFGWGPKIGLTVDKMHMSTDVFDTDNRCGFTGGLTGEYIIPVANFGFDISLMYSYMRSHVDYVDSNGQIHGESSTANFFEIPLHLKYMIGIPVISKVVKPYIYTGPSVAFKLGGHDNVFNSKKTQWGWDLGIGLEFVKKLQIGAGYTFGINNIAKEHWSNIAGNTGHDIKVKNNYWTVSIAWMFNK